ncbi:efflux transporter outer membrane subunit [Phocaeicola faecicola]|uniref:efflux transporter outer membrane subunit n=1 Tax=Phocaeicola faecicola TaxID=2739389 RepID=UPI002A831FFE|nr:efflux transporter outer membrane subunit [Phocaeicola faecicola]MDD6909375.1 efflux transporter outer membrane subunit [Bacteroidaceae bacterium]MDY4871579.1 efflux transporter outer membrane subunit [Phocaeicola faecicola]
MMMKKQIIGTMCLAALMSSCHIYKSYDRPETIDASGIYRDPASAVDTLAADTANMGNLPWKEIFRDAKLQALIEEGLSKNVDIQAAALRVQEAKVMLTAAKLSYLPSINLAPQGTATSMGGSNYVKAYQLPVSASWEIDLFGKILNTKRGQKVAYEQSKYAEQAVRSQIICGIANVYYSLLMLDRQVEITTETAAIYKENVRAMEAMKIAGMTTEAAVAQMRAASHQVEASLLDLKRQVRETENSLAVLLARTPQTVERGTLAEQVMPEELAAGVPMQLLENRPDVKMAEMTLAAAYYTTNSARAAFYPGLNITGLAGWTNGSGVTVVNPGEFMLQALASLAQPIFNNGKLIVNLKVSKAEEKIAQMNYQQTILEAGKEVSDALFLFDTQTKKLAEDRGQVEQLDKAVTYTNALFQSGEATYLELLTSQQNLLSAQLSEVADNFQRIQAVINLYSALGGGRE